MFFYSKLLTLLPGFVVIVIGSSIVVANANEVKRIGDTDTDTDNTDSTVHKAEANRGLRTVVMPPPSVRSLEATATNDCSDTNWYWHPDEQKCARGLGAFGISFSAMPDCCKQAFGDNACDWHDECNHLLTNNIVPSSEQPVDVVEASDAPVEVEQTFFEFEAYHHGGNSNSVTVSTKAAKSSPSKSSKTTGYITKMETAGIHVRMKGDGDSDSDSTSIRSALGDPNTVQVWRYGPFRIDAYCDKPKGERQGPRDSYLGMELTITAPDNEDLYLIGQSMDIYHWTSNYDYESSSSFDDDRCSGSQGDCHKLLAGESTIIKMMDADHFFGGEYSDHRAKSGKRWKDGSAFYAMRPDGTYFYIGWNQNQFTGLHEDDFEISDFLGIDPDSEEAVDCLMMGEINFYQS